MLRASSLRFSPSVHIIYTTPTTPLSHLKPRTTRSCNTLNRTNPLPIITRTAARPVPNPCSPLPKSHTPRRTLLGSIPRSRVSPGNPACSSDPSGTNAASDPSRRPAPPLLRPRGRSRTLRRSQISPQDFLHLLRRHTLPGDILRSCRIACR